MLNQHYDAFGVQDIIAEAGVARSTFYTHFRDKDDLLLVSLSPILKMLSDLAQGTAAKSSTQALLEHIWENRQLGRVFFQAPLVGRIGRTLTAALTDSGDPTLVFRMHGILGVLGMWCEGRLDMNAAKLADYFIAEGSRPWR